MGLHMRGVNSERLRGSTCVIEDLQSEIILDSTTGGGGNGCFRS